MAKQTLSKPLADVVITKTAEAPAVLLDRTVKVSKKARRTIQHGKVAKGTKQYWNTLGPGLVTGAAGQDPSGIATYSQTGAHYGFHFLWLAAWLYPLDANLEAMCARIGLVTGEGLAANIRKHFSQRVLRACALLLFLTNAINIGADLGAMAKAAQLVKPSLSFCGLVLGFSIFTIALQIFVPYAKYAKYLKYLAFVLVAYIISAAMAHLNWHDVLAHSLKPQLQFNKQDFIILCAIMGTTISPYLFFWQTSQEVEEEILHGKKTIKSRQAMTSRKEVRNMRIDVWSGMFFSELIMFFIIAACGGVLFLNGVTNITSATQAAEALRPFAGNATYWLFAIGIVGSGILAIPVLAGSSSYIVAESFHWREGLYRKLGQASAFYGIIIISVLVGFGINLLGIDPIKALIYAAMINGIVAPVVMVLILRISSNKKLMGKWATGPVAQLVGWLTTIAMAAAGIAAIYALF
ncbi:MAG TPA: Nramp family divalent metal transporter [Candidatus Saccharimonadales bacterium]|jgi:NRAMP (natural resistance-associated macrophage protein)-like metal ion transporter